MQGIFVGLVFLLRSWKRRQPNHLFFGLFLLVLAYLVLAAFLFEARLAHYLPHLLATNTPGLYLLGPLLYFYIRYSIEPGFSISFRSVWHLIPFLICVAMILPFYLYGSDFKVAYILNAYQSDGRLPASRAWFYAPAWLQNVAYWGYLYLLLRRYRQTSRTSAKWIWESWKIYGLFLLVFTTVFLLFVIGTAYPYQVRYSGYLLVSLILHLYGYAVLSRTRVLSDEPVPVSIAQSRQPLSNAIDLETIKSSLLELMENQKAYLDADLKISDLAERLDISTHQLSQLINSEFECRFSDFVNAYRIKAAKKMMSDPAYRHYTLEGIARESGFNNRTTFNRAFKKHAQMTPTQFLSR